MKNIFKRICFSFLVVLSFLLCSCGLPFQKNTKSLSSQSTKLSNGLVNEPTISSTDVSIVSNLSEHQNRSILLSGIADNMESSVLYLNDKIVFSSSKVNNKKNIQLSIKAECIKDGQLFINEKEIQYKPEILLIELIPEKLFVYADAWWKHPETTTPPMCQFYFVAKDKTESLHIFQLPHLPIQSFGDSLSVSLFQESEFQSNPSQLELIDQYPMLIFDPNKKLTGYHLLVSDEKKIDQLKLICEHFNFSTPVASYRLYELQTLLGLTTAIFEKSSYSVELDNEVKAEGHRNQSCRFLSFYKNQIMGVSQLFPLVFPAQGEVQLKILQGNDYAFESRSNLQELNNKDTLIDDLQDRNSLYGPYHDIAALEITNQSQNTLRLYISDTRFFADLTYFYHNMPYIISQKFAKAQTIPEADQQLSSRLLFNHHKMGEVGFFIPSEPRSASLFFTDQAVLQEQNTPTIVQKEGVVIQWGQLNHPEQALITLKPNASVQLPLSLDVYEKGCYVEQDQKHSMRRDFRDDHLFSISDIQTTGAVIQGYRPLIYQVLDDQSFESAENSVIQTLKWSIPPDTSSFSEEQLQKKRKPIFISFGVEDAFDDSLYNINKDNKRKVNRLIFYKNSCDRLEQERVHPGFIEDSLVWTAYKRKDQSIRFRKKYQDSLYETQSAHIQRHLVKIFRLIEDQKRREKEAQARSFQQAIDRRPCPGCYIP